MATFGENLRAFRERRHLSIRALARKAGVDPGTVARAEKLSDASSVTHETFQALATGLGVSVDILDALARGRLQLDDAGSRTTDARPVAGWDDFRPDPQTEPLRPELQPEHERRRGWPVSTMVAAGGPVDYEAGIIQDQYLPYALVPFPHLAPMAVVVKGTSMAPLINEGDVIVIPRKPVRAIRHGDVVFVELTQGRGRTLKRLNLLKDGTLELVPENTRQHSVQRLEPADIAWAVYVLGWFNAMWPGNEMV